MAGCELEVVVADDVSLDAGAVVGLAVGSWVVLPTAVGTEAGTVVVGVCWGADSETVLGGGVFGFCCAVGGTVVSESGTTVVGDCWGGRSRVEVSVVSSVD